MKNRVLIKDLHKHQDKEVTLCGWIHTLRILSKFSFLVLRDRSGTVQCIVDGQVADTKQFHHEDCVSIQGKVIVDKSEEPIRDRYNEITGQTKR